MFGENLGKHIFARDAHRWIRCDEMVVGGWIRGCGGLEEGG